MDIFNMNKKITIVNVGRCQFHSVSQNDVEKVICEGGEPMDASDGYHTFTELYEHRITLFIALCKYHAEYVEASVWKTKEGRKDNVWRSKLHSDGTGYEGWFILGIGKEKGKQITYHLPLDKWEETEFAETLEKAPEFDGHTSNDVLERLKQL